MPANRLNNVPIAMYFATHFYFCFYHVLSNACLRRVATGYAPGLAKTALRVAVVAALAYLTAFLETLTISGFPYWRFDDRHQAYTVGSAFYGIYFVVSFPAFLLIVAAPTRGLDRVAATPRVRGRDAFLRRRPGFRDATRVRGDAAVFAPTPRFRAACRPRRVRDVSATFPRQDETPANVVNGQTHTLRRAFVEALAAAMAVLFLLDFVRLALGIPFKMEIAPFF